MTEGRRRYAARVCKVPTIAAGGSLEVPLGDRPTKRRAGTSGPVGRTTPLVMLNGCSQGLCAPALRPVTVSLALLD